MNTRKMLGFLMLAILTAAGIAAQSNDAKSSAAVPVFEFRVRSAFALTPAMVNAIQVASAGIQPVKKDASPASQQESTIPPWGLAAVKAVQLAAPFGIRIQGEQIVALIVFTPLEPAKNELTLLVQNQIWAKSSSDSIQMNTSFHTIRVPLGMLFYYYPLGMDPKRGAPVALELIVQQK